MALIESTQEGRPLYRVRWNYSRGEDGRQRYDEKRFRKRSEAIAFNREKSAGHTLSTETITLNQLIAVWMERHVDTDALQKRTRKDYKCHCRLRLQPYLGSRKVSKLTPKVVGEWREWMASRQTGPRTINKSLDLLRAVIRWGRSEGLCMNVMVDDVRRVKTPRPQPANPYPPQTVKRIAAGCQHLRDATFVQLAAYSGLRWSELRALRWTDIASDFSSLYLTRALDMDMSLKMTKSERHRQIPILAPGVEALKLWRAHAPDTDLVFCTRTGRPIGENNWYSQRLPKIRAACGIEFDLHELRDTYASILIQTGVGEAELTLWLGHKSIQTTLNRYAKLFNERKMVIVERANLGLADL